VSLASHEYETIPSETGSGLRLVGLGWCVVIGETVTEGYDCPEG